MEVNNRLEDGLHEGITPRAYHSWKFDPTNPSEGPISCSLLKRFISVGPYRFRYETKTKRAPSSAMTWGSLVDCLLFTPDLVDEQFVSKEDNPHLSSDGSVRTADAREWRDEHLGRGVEVVTEKERADAGAAVLSLMNTPISYEIVACGKHQVGLVASLHHGIPIKGLLDVVPSHPKHDDSLADLKTTSADIYNDDELARQVGRFGYHIQAAMYLHLWNLITGESRNRFQLIWQSASEPYEVRVTELDNLSLEAGGAMVSCYLSRLEDCIMRKMWVSPFAESSTILPMHTPTILSQENMMDTLSELDRTNEGFLKGRDA